MVTRFPGIVNFVFADVEGNLKVCFKDPCKGRGVHNSDDMLHLSKLILAQEDSLEFPDTSSEEF